MTWIARRVVRPCQEVEKEYGLPEGSLNKRSDTMSIDLSKLGSAPWGYCYDGSSDWSVGPKDDPQDGIITVSSGDDEVARTHSAVVAECLNALDVQMRRGWHASLANDGKTWFADPICDDAARASALFMEWVYCQGYDNPATALVEADEWFKANVEKQPS